MTSDRITALLATAPIIDGHNDLPWEMRTRVGYDLDQIDVGQNQSATGLHTDLIRLGAGGVGAQFWSVYVPVGQPEPQAVVATLEQIDFVVQMARRYPDRMMLAGSAQEVLAARAQGKIAALMGVEGGHCIAESLAVLRMLYHLGARYLTLTHNSNTSWADSATDTPAVGGLSDFGCDVVRECNRLGMLVDLSHVAPATMHAALDTTRAPAFFSHSSARAICDHPRNVPDDVLGRVRDCNGIVMVTFVPGFITEPARQWMLALIVADRERGLGQDDPGYRAARDAWLAQNPRPRVTAGDVADHVEHVREVAGVDCVGIGGDFDGTVGLPEGLADVAAYPTLLAELASRGWSDSDLAKLTWHNALRVLQETETVAG